MSAFPESGRSEAPKSGKTKVRFRPQAVILGQDSGRIGALIDGLVTGASSMSDTNY